MTLIRTKDITGQKFGKLTAIRQTGEVTQKGYIWELECECGNIVYRTVAELNTGDYSSCGCLRSKMELFFKELLDEYYPDVKYIRQWKCEDLKLKRQLTVDYYLSIDGKDIFVELDGTQHYNKNDTWYNKDSLRRDIEKNKFFLERDATLYRIPYIKEKEKLKCYLDAIYNSDEEWLKNNCRELIYELEE